MVFILLFMISSEFHQEELSSIGTLLKIFLTVTNGKTIMGNFNDMERTAKQAILNTAESIGRESAIDLFKKSLLQLEARLAAMQSVTNVEGATVVARQLLSSVLIYGSRNLGVVLSGLRDGYYSTEQLPDAVNLVCVELKVSIKEVKSWLFSSSNG